MQTIPILLSTSKQVIDIKHDIDDLLHLAKNVAMTCPVDSTFELFDARLLDIIRCYDELCNTGSVNIFFELKTKLYLFSNQVTHYLSR